MLTRPEEGEPTRRAGVGGRPAAPGGPPGDEERRPATAGERGGERSERATPIRRAQGVARNAPAVRRRWCLARIPPPADVHGPSPLECSGNRRASPSFPVRRGEEVANRSERAGLSSPSGYTRWKGWAGETRPSHDGTEAASRLSYRRLGPRQMPQETVVIGALSCPVCGLGFRTETELRQHLATAHRGGEGATPGPAEAPTEPMVPSGPGPILDEGGGGLPPPLGAPGHR